MFFEFEDVIRLKIAHNAFADYYLLRHFHIELKESVGYSIASLCGSVGKDFIYRAWGLDFKSRLK